MLKSLENIKFLSVSPGDLVLSLDRLTRFKYPGYKYYRVFNDILLKYLVSPKYSKNELLNLDTETYKSLVEIVWNGSVKKYCPQDSNVINNLIKNEEFGYYNLSDELKILIDNKLNYDGVLSLVESEDSLPVNIKRFIYTAKNVLPPADLRRKYGLKFPVEKIVLCEGITEEILLPCFSSRYGYDFDKEGVHLISAGGKNQVAKLYCELREELKLPVFVLLDFDAVETSQVILRMKRDIDRLHLIHHGEFEDLFSLFLIKRTINNCYKNIIQCKVDDFKSNKPMTRVLGEYFRVNNLGDFQKADFARAVADNVNGKKDLTDEIVEIIEEIKSL